MAVEIALADVSELRGKGIDVLTKQVIAGKSASNDPADNTEVEKPKAEAKPKEDDGVTKRIGELTRKQREAERSAQAEREARLKAEAERDELKAKAEKKPAPERPVKPKREDFDDGDAYEKAQDAYTEALTDFKVSERLAKAEDEKAAKAKDDKSKQAKEASDKQQREDGEKIAQRFAEQQEAARKAHDDFDEVVEASASVMLKPSLAVALVKSEVGGELQYHLAKHPEVIEKLNGMEQDAMLKELGKIELSLEPKSSADGAVDLPRGADGKFASKDVSAAAKPIEPVKEQRETAKGEKDPESMSVAEHREAAFRASRR